MTTIKCLPLGAGQDVGKSCVIVTINGKRIMFDCGMHMGYEDDRRYPDFSLISKDGNFTDKIACVIITHFHLDHIGALPYFTEVCGYNGPIFMTYPTKALAPLMLEDYRKIMVDRKGEQEQFTLQHIHRCMEKVTAIDLKETVQVGSDMIIRSYYAGHVLGAAMFYVKVGGGTVVYTGDYNMTPDRHLGAAQIDRLQPDLLITESTYATTIRDSKHAREREFLNVVHNCISNGGKVLIPVFALGRAQELCILLDDYWERMNLTIPIYFSAGLTMQANVYYKLLISWTSQKVKNTYVTRNTFDFKHVSPFDRSQIEAPGPCVLFATPGMLSGGLSLEVFKKWAVSEQNLTVLPGYCMVGTVGHKLMSGKPSHIEVDKRSQVDVRCQIHQLSFSAHTDARGIMDLVKYVDPCHVVLVHGEKPKMTVLKSRIATELGIPCYDPANHEMVEVPTRFLEVDASRKFIDLSLLHHISTKALNLTKEGSEESNSLCALASKAVAVEGILARSASNVKLLHPTEASSALGLTSHEIINSCNCTAHFCDENVTQTVDTMDTSEQEKMKHLDKRPRVELRRTQSLDLERTPVDDESEPESENYTQSDMNVQQPQSLRTSNLKVYLDMNELPSSSSPIEESPGKEAKANADLGIIIKCDVITALYSELRSWLGENAMEKKDDSLVAGSLCIQVQEICQEMPAAGTTVDCEKILPVKLTCTWSHSDDTLARRALGVLRTRQFKMPASSS